MQTSVRSNQLIAGFFFVFLALQIAIPTLLLTATRPARWGWQMYSAFAVAPEISLQKVDGNVERLVLKDHLANVRYEMLQPGKLLPHLCALSSDVAAVQFHIQDATEVYQCHS